MTAASVDDLPDRARRATRWSLLTQVLTRLVTPVTQLVLARVLGPEAFGIVALVLMVTSFADMLTDAGFQKFLVQRATKDDKALDEYANVAFWSSLAISVVLVAVIAVFRDPLAALLGDGSLGPVLVVASLAIPLTVIASTQRALFRRALEYKRVAPIQVGAALLTLVVALPLALLGADYWSLIIGVLASSLATSIAFFVVSAWKPRRFYSFRVLREMLSLSTWTLLESLSIWVSAWAGVLVVGSVLSQHEVGLYRQPTLVVTSMYAIITAATTPVLFAALSRLQHDLPEFRSFFFDFQRRVATFVLPIGAGAFLFREFFTEVLFGPDWSDASLMFGVWALAWGVLIPFSHYCSEVFRALGRPQISLLSQVLFIAVMVPVLYFAALQGFTTLVIATGAIRILQIVINQVLLRLVAGITTWQVVRNLIAPIGATLAMTVLGLWLASATQGDFVLSSLGVVACAVAYLSVALLIPETRVVLTAVLPSFRRPERSS